MATIKSEVAQELAWQAKDDARVLAQTEEIKADSARKKRAIIEVRKMVRDKEKEVTSFKKVAKSNSKPKPKPKTTRNKR